MGGMANKARPKGLPRTQPGRQQKKCPKGRTANQVGGVVVEVVEVKWREVSAMQIEVVVRNRV